MSNLCSVPRNWPAGLKLAAGRLCVLGGEILSSSQRAREASMCRGSQRKRGRTSLSPGVVLSWSGWQPVDDRLQCSRPMIVTSHMGVKRAVSEGSWLSFVSRTKKHVIPTVILNGSTRLYNLKFCPVIQWNIIFLAILDHGAKSLWCKVVDFSFFEHLFRMQSRCNRPLPVEWLCSGSGLCTSVASSMDGTLLSVWIALALAKVKLYTVHNTLYTQLYA